MQNSGDPQFILVAFVSLLLLTVSAGLSYLRKWVRTPAMVLSVILIAAFPVGTLLGPYFIYLLRSPKTEVVFSDEYRTVIKQTRHVRMKTPVIAWIVLVAILTLVASGVVFLRLG